MRIELQDCIKLLREKDHFLIVTHARPDGDTIGSAAALCLALREIGKTAYLYNNPEFSDNYMEYAEEFLPRGDFDHRFTIGVDMASRDLRPIGFLEEIDLCIDHHHSNSIFARWTLLYDYSSCGEAILEVIKALPCDMNQKLAELLYIAISTDTGCFCYGNTDANTHRAAAELVDYGARNGYLNKKLFRTVSLKRIQLECMIYAKMDFYRDGSLAIATITLDMLEGLGAVEDDCEDISSLPGRIAGVMVGITVREVAPDNCKVSVRTSEQYRADKICAQFGGGGHTMAAGCTLDCEVQKARELVLKAALEETG